ncbi:MAG: cytochrome c5 [Granulosicoccus sp.]|jgi:cytochrome c5
MSGATDSGMLKNMGWILGVVTGLALVIGFAAQIFGPNVTDPNDPIIRNALIERIEPVASVRTSTDDLPQASAVMVVATGPKSAEELVSGACAACHAAGVAGAPLLGDDAAWASRRELGLDALVASVINGKGAMAARGGSTYSDEEITRAVQHIAMFEFIDPVEQTLNEGVEVTDAVVEELLGQLPEGLTDNVEAAVNGVCAGCHIAGVANAPKFGDQEAWQPRIDKGLEALTASVINGLNVMPPRGGSNLTDEEIPIAIQYMLSK